MHESLRPSYNSLLQDRSDPSLPLDRKRRYHISRWSTRMSQYEFHCPECKREFTQSLHMSEREKTEVACPYCGSKHVEQLVMAFSAVTSKKS